MLKHILMIPRNVAEYLQLFSDTFVHDEFALGSWSRTPVGLAFPPQLGSVSLGALEEGNPFFPGRSNQHLRYRN